MFQRLFLCLSALYGCAALGAPLPQGSPASAGLDAARLEEARDFALKGGGSGLVVRHGKVVFRWGDQKRRYDLKSSSKSIGFTAVGVALADGKVKSLDEPASRSHPYFRSGKSPWLGKITLFHLATQTAGFDKPGGSEKLLFAPGTKWSYSDSGPNWLAECVTLLYRRDVEELLFERVFTPIGIGRNDLRWRKNAYRPHTIDGVARREFGSGVHANVEAMARIGLLYLHGGKWGNQQLIPAKFVDACRTVPGRVRGLPVLKAEAHGRASDHYGLLWWNNADGTLKDVPRDTYWSWGLYESLIVVFPSLDMVVARAGKSFPGKWAGHYDRLAPFFGPLVAATRKRGLGPRPPSPVIAGIEWAPAKSIVRLATDSDNWPLAWADDGHLYTAYGDGHGFRPQVKRKLSMGLGRVEGDPPDIRGVNIRSATAEDTGGGAGGRKASGMLCIDGTLYMWVRNANKKGAESQLGWSRDHGLTWEWANWRFTKSFGYPTFISFGRDYAGARDDFVYVVSHDSPSAYTPSDRMVLARVPKAALREHRRYEFFQEIGALGKPVWTREITQRGAVFTHAPKRCYRSGISYNAALKRYLWVQIVPGKDTRFQGGFGVYDAPEPWGPWTTVFITEQWDVGPGETASFPPKWMSADGRSVHLVFSGNDRFAVRRGTLVPRRRE